jgi:transcriptional regulator with XRE-family HTH domain
MTEVQLAERSGVSRDTVRNLEKGRSIGTENLLKIARGLGLLDQVTAAFDPLNSDLGRLRAAEQLPIRVRPRRMTRGDLS